MQGNELVPGGENIVPRRAFEGGPHGSRRDRPLNSLKKRRKSAPLEIGTHLFGLLGGVGRVVMIIGEGRDDAGPQLVGLGIGHFQRRDLLEVIMQKPGVVNQALQDQGLAAREAGALWAYAAAAVYRPAGQ